MELNRWQGVPELEAAMLKQRASSAVGVTGKLIIG
jgi:hypothetical protein